MVATSHISQHRAGRTGPKGEASLHTGYADGKVYRNQYAREYDGEIVKRKEIVDDVRKALSEVETNNETRRRDDRGGGTAYSERSDPGFLRFNDVVLTRRIIVSTSRPFRAVLEPSSGLFACNHAQGLV
jgi:hypothetical protein